MNGNWVDRHTDQPTAAKQYALLSSKGGIIKHDCNAAEMCETQNSKLIDHNC
jgi:hypothetical protein